jgi:hypothetical protein
VRFPCTQLEESGIGKVGDRGDQLMEPRKPQEIAPGPTRGSQCLISQGGFPKRFGNVAVGAGQPLQQSTGTDHVLEIDGLDSPRSRTHEL